MEKYTVTVDLVEGGPTGVYVRNVSFTTALRTLSQMNIHKGDRIKILKDNSEVVIDFVAPADSKSGQ